MIAIRRSDQRGYVDGELVQRYHSFSFGSFYDPSSMQFRSLRVVNEERVAPGQGFDTHDHQNMEILSYVLDGELLQTDSFVAVPDTESITGHPPGRPRVRFESAKR